MNFITPGQLIRFLKLKLVPCVSLYQPTHRHHPDTQQDRVRYRNLAARIERELSDRYPPAVRNPLLSQFKNLESDEFFWRQRTEGLVVLCAPGEFHTFDLQHPTAERAVIADTFHLKPLLRHVQSADTFQVLALTRTSIRLFEGNRYAMDQLDLKGVPATLKEALGETLTEPHLTVASYGLGSGGPAGRGHAPPMVHGHGSRKDEIDLDTQRFFRMVDKAIMEKYSLPSNRTLVLAGLAENQGQFRKLSQNPNLLSAGIEKDPEKLSVDEIREKSWKLLEPHYLERLRKLKDEFAFGKSRGIASDSVEESAKAATQGRVARALIDADRHLDGSLLADGTVQLNNDKHLRVDADVLDDIGEWVLRTGGEVIVVPGALMPTRTGIAALMRY